MYNNVTMMGRIVNDLELKVTPNGISVCQFRIAVDRRYQTKGEERKNGFFQCRGLAKIRRVCNKVVCKGAYDTCPGRIANAIIH